MRKFKVTINKDEIIKYETDNSEMIAISEFVLDNNISNTVNISDETLWKRYAVLLMRAYTESLYKVVIETPFTITEPTFIKHPMDVLNVFDFVEVKYIKYIQLTNPEMYTSWDIDIE